MNNEGNNNLEFGSNKTNKKLILTIFILISTIMLAILITILLLNKKESKVNINEVDNPQTNIVDDPIQNCYITVSDADDFINKIQAFENCEEYKVTYKNLKYVVKKNKNENFEAYMNKIFYLDNELKYSDSDSQFTSHLLKSYILNSNNETDTFLFIFQEVPVTQNPKHYILLFNGNGEILFKINFNAMGDVLFDIENKVLSYAEMNVSFQLPSVALSNEKMCEYLQQYNQEIMHKASYSYKFIDNEMKLIESSKMTVKDLMEEYNC